MAELCIALEINPPLTAELGWDELRDQILDLARDAAHGIGRPAAPLTTFLAGYAAGVRGGGPQEVREVMTEIGDVLKERER
jgi:hypothetical protein